MIVRLGEPVQFVWWGHLSSKVPDASIFSFPLLAGESKEQLPHSGLREEGCLPPGLGLDWSSVSYAWPWQLYVVLLVDIHSSVEPCCGLDMDCEK